MTTSLNTVKETVLPILTNVLLENVGTLTKLVSVISVHLSVIVNTV